MSAQKRSAEEIISALGLSPHAEGGYYKQVYRSGECTVEGKQRAYATSIYFLLKSGQASHLHVLKSDELWYYHMGSSVLLTIIGSQGELIEQVLGNDVLKGECPQVLIPAGGVFCAQLLEEQNVMQEKDEHPEENFALVGCMVAPGFEYEDFYLPSKEELKVKFPNCIAFIEQFAL